MMSKIRQGFLFPDTLILTGARQSLTKQTCRDSLGKHCEGLVGRMGLVKLMIGRFSHPRGGSERPTGERGYDGEGWALKAQEALSSNPSTVPGSVALFLPCDSSPLKVGLTSGICHVLYGFRRTTCLKVPSTRPITFHF